MARAAGGLGADVGDLRDRCGAPALGKDQWLVAFGVRTCAGFAEQRLDGGQAVTAGHQTVTVVRLGRISPAGRLAAVGARSARLAGGAPDVAPEGGRVVFGGMAGAGARG